MPMQILNAAEEREKTVIGLEAELARWRRDLEHEHSTRLAEAEATVRRLQVLTPVSHCPSHVFAVGQLPSVSVTRLVLLHHNR